MRVGRAVLRSGGSRVLVLAIALLALSGPAASEAFAYEYDGRVVHAGATVDATPDTPVDLHQRLEASASRAVRYAYDAPTGSRVGGSVALLAENLFSQVVAGREGVASPSVGVGGTSMTSVVSLVTPRGTPGGGGQTVRHYTTPEAAEQIAKSGQVRPGLESGKIWVTPDKYADGAAAQARLALDKTPGGYFEIPVCRIQCPTAPSTVRPTTKQPGGGIEITTTSPIDITDLPFIPFRPR